MKALLGAGSAKKRLQNLDVKELSERAPRLSPNFSVQL
jgi:hypothetical protein